VLLRVLRDDGSGDPFDDPTGNSGLMAEQLYKEKLQRQLKEDDDLDDTP